MPKFKRTNQPKREFCDLTHEELQELWRRVVATAVDFAKEKNIGGLSAAGRWNLYNKLADAVYDYHDNNLESDCPKNVVRFPDDKWRGYVVVDFDDEYFD